MTVQEQYLEKLRTDFLNNPFFNLVGFDVHHIDKGEVQLCLEIKEDHMNVLGTVHGGVYASLIDTTMGMTAFSVSDDIFTTVNLNIHYLKHCSEGKLFCKGLVISNGRSIYTIQAEIFNESEELLAYGTGTFKLIKMNK